jgi:phage replication-related protein YjqB (UPF0714/DUF867 family)
MMANDRFRSYHDLAAVYSRGQDFDVSARTGLTNSSVLILAPHGGRIEIRTAEIADATAAHDYSCYLFEAKLRKNNRKEMHIASELYDVPEALTAVTSGEVVVAVHGRSDGDDTEKTWIGGLNQELSKRIGDALNSAGFQVLFDPPKFKGIHPNNICNRGLTKEGVQLEIPLSLRERFRDDHDHERAYVLCLRAAIADYTD